MGLLIVIIGCWYAFTFRSGHGWGDDFALFLLHARNIAEGRPYGDTGFIYNPLASSYSPQNYPPGFPLLLAPFYPFFGLNYTAYKLLILLFFMGTLWLIYILLRNKTSFLNCIIVIVLFGLSPYMWELGNNVLSDIPATFFIFLTICLELKRTQKDSKVLAVSEGLSMYIAYAMRTTGIVLLPALLFRFFIEKKRKDRSFIILLIAFLIPAIVQGIVMPKGSGYMEMVAAKYDGLQFNAILHSVMTSANRYIEDLRSFSLLAPVNATLNILFATFCFALFITGWYLHARKHFSFIDVFLLLFTLLICVWPFYQGIRYLLPLLPFYVYFIFNAIAAIDAKWFRRVMLSAFLLIFFILYNGFYTHTTYHTVLYGTETATSQKVFEFIRKNTGEHDVIMSSKPRAFCLYTSRKGIVFPDVGDPGLYYKCLDENKVKYIVTGLEYNTIYLQNAKDDTVKFSPVYSNELFQVYRVNP